MFSFQLCAYFFGSVDDLFFLLLPLGPVHTSSSCEIFRHFREFCLLVLILYMMLEGFGYECLSVFLKTRTMDITQSHEKSLSMLILFLNVGDFQGY